MSKTSINFDDKKINKSNIYQNKKLLKIDDIHCVKYRIIARNYAETVPFHKISTSGNSVKLRYFTQW